MTDRRIPDDELPVEAEERRVDVDRVILTRILATPLDEALAAELEAAEAPLVDQTG